MPNGVSVKQNKKFRTIMLVSEFKISGIKCDTPHCNWRDDDVQFADYPQFIDKPCPVCNSNLLTEQDYIKCLKMYRIVDRANKISNMLKWLNPKHYYRLITKTTEPEVEMKIRLPKK